MTVVDLIKVVMSELKGLVKTETVVGEPIEAGGITIIPVSKVSVGFGAGGDEGSKKSISFGSGTGGGASIEPVAFIVVSEGKAQLLPLAARKPAFADVVDLIPRVIEKVREIKSQRKEKPKGEKMS